MYRECSLLIAGYAGDGDLNHGILRPTQARFGVGLSSIGPSSAEPMPDHHTKSLLWIMILFATTKRVLAMRDAVFTCEVFSRWTLPQGLASHPKKPWAWASSYVLYVARIGILCPMYCDVPRKHDVNPNLCR